MHFPIFKDKLILNKIEGYIRSYFFVFILISVVLFYGNTIFNGFVHDDITDIKNNVYLKDVKYFPKIFTACIDEYYLLDCRTKGYYYRPLGQLSYFIDFRISSAPWIFHATNIFYLYILSLLLYAFLRIFTKSYTIALAGVLAFIAHPVISEVVNGLANVYDLLFGIFLLLMIIFYVFYRTKKDYKYLILSALSYFFLLLTKETSVFTIILLPLYDYLFGSSQKNSLKYYFNLFLYVIPLAIYLLLRILSLGGLIYQQPDYYRLTFLQQVTTAVGFLGKYVLLLFYPLPLNAAYRFVPIGMSDPTFIFSLIVILCLLPTVFYLYKKGLKIILFGFSIFIVSLLPIILLFTKIGPFPFAQRYIFVPLLGASLIFADVLRLIFAKNKSANLKMFIGIIFCFCLVLSWFIVVNRNLDWNNDKSYALSLIKADSNNPDGYYELGKYYIDTNNYSNAAKALKKTLDLDPNDSSVLLLLNKVNLQEYNSNKISFFYPKSFSLSEGNNGEVLLRDKTGFSIFINITKKDPNLSVYEYLSSQKNSYGTLVNQGLAKIPNVDLAYVRIWNYKNTGILEFYLFKVDSVARIMVGPSNSFLMSTFDQIVSSLKIKK